MGNEVIYYEASASPVAMAALVDSGDNKFFRGAHELWSNASGAAATVRPDGIISGGAITPGSGNDAVNVSALSFYQAGLKRDIANTAISITRGTLPMQKFSIAVDNTQTIISIEGTEHATTFSDERGEDGGPPFIPDGHIEVAQVHVTGNTPAVILSTELKDIVGLHRERFDFPSWTERRVNVVAGVPGMAGAEFVAALPLIHTGGIPKQVHASYSVPDFAEIAKSSDFVPPETTHSVSSTTIYGQAIGSSSSSLNQGTFTTYLDDGITDAIIQKKDEVIFFKFKPDKLKVPYLLCQGKFGMSRAFPAGENYTAACTISAESGVVEVSS